VPRHALFPDQPIELACPNCGKRLKAPRNLAGRTVKCPSCKKEFRISDQSQASGDPKLDF
jgi:endogenous inhibitor of DNA gyrase (YacG/DUF329 family)